MQTQIRNTLNMLCQTVSLRSEPSSVSREGKVLHSWLRSASLPAII